MLLLLPLVLGGCSLKTEIIDHSRNDGIISEFVLTSPANGVSISEDITFTWEEATNVDYYQLEIADNVKFIKNNDNHVYLREGNLSTNTFKLNYSLPTKDILYYWKVTAFNENYTVECSEIGNFFYESSNTMELPINIEDAQDWVLHKEGSYADISIDKTNFFGNNKNALAIVFDKEHTCQGIPKSDGWIVITKTEDRELYGTDAFYLNFYYSGHDATVLIRVLDYDGEYWHNQVRISSNAKQTVLMKYEDFSLRTSGTNIFNRKFDWYHIRYFEIVFERTFGDGVCLISDIKSVKSDNYKYMFIQKMDFRSSDPKDWTNENFDFAKTISEDGSEITLGYEAKNAETNPNGFSGYGFQNINVYKYLVTGDALRMKVKYTGTGSSAIFYFRVLEEDNDRWQFKVPFTYLIKDDYKEIIIPLKAFQRVEYMNGDGAKQFYYIQKFNVGLADNYSTGSITIKDLEVVKIDDIVPSRKRVVGEDGIIENFNDYNLYTEMYYYWEQSEVNKDEAMKLDTIHKSGGRRNSYCAEFDYKADMEQAVYQLYLNTKAVENKNAFSIWLKDATPVSADVKYINNTDSEIELEKREKVSAEMTIQLTMESGEWYRYVIDNVKKEWTVYTISFDDFELVNAKSLYNDPKPLECGKIIHMAFGFKFLSYDEKGVHRPTYAIANPVYLDEIAFVNASETKIEEISNTIKEDEDNPNRITIDTMENYLVDEDIFDYWNYASEKEYNSMTLSDDVSSEGGAKSLKMHYKGSDSVSYSRITQFASTVTAKGLIIDIKGDGKATVYLNMNWRVGATLYKMRYTVDNIPTSWTRYVIGFSNFKDVNGSTKVITSNDVKNIEYISFGIVNSDNKESDIYVDNVVFSKDISKGSYISVTPIDEED